MSYANLEQRMARAYLDMFPPFFPLENGPVSIASQEQFYRFMKHVLQAIFDSPQLFFSKINEDDAYPNRFNRAAYGKPKLNIIMKKDLAEIDELLALLFEMGWGPAVEGDAAALSRPAVPSRMILPENLKIKKKHLAMLPRLGLVLEGRALTCPAFPGLFPAWQWLATRDSARGTAGVVPFSRAMFDPAYPYTQVAYRALLGSAAAFDRIVQHLVECGYERVELERGPYTLDYIKQSTPGSFPLGYPIHGDRYHYGFSAEYTSYASVPQFWVLRILEMKNILLQFDQHPAGVQQFIFRYAKKCDNCAYCTQTDKTGRRKQLAIDVTFAGAPYRICPLYPGFNFNANLLDDALAEAIIAFLDVMDAMFEPPYKPGDRVRIIQNGWDPGILHYCLASKGSTARVLSMREYLASVSRSEGAAYVEKVVAAINRGELIPIKMEYVAPLDPDTDGMLMCSVGEVQVIQKVFLQTLARGGDTG